MAPARTRYAREMTIRRLELESGVEIECEDIGEGERPFVLVHGFTGSRDDWREQMPRLAELRWIDSKYVSQCAPKRSPMMGSA